MKTICPTINVEIHLNKHFDMHGMQQWQIILWKQHSIMIYYRLMEFSCNLCKVQTPDWLAANTEFTNKSCTILWNETVCNLLEGFSKRQHSCVDAQPGKLHLIGHKLLIAAKWAFEKGTPEAIRIHTVAMALTAVFRVECTQHLKLWNLKYDILWSVASSLSEMPAMYSLPMTPKKFMSAILK